MSSKCALITGITGIEGQVLAKLLLSKGWTVHGVARKPRPYLPKDVKMVYTDLMNKEKAKQDMLHLKEVTYLFFCAWAPASSPQEENENNAVLFRNTLDIVEEHRKLEHVYLQTGTKYYGMHVGPEKGYKVPSKEDDPRISTPVFYYDQEDTLLSRSAKGGWTWSIARPDAIMGFALNTAMNLASTLAIYAVLLKEEGKPLVFPFKSAFDKPKCFSDAKLLSRAIYWMSTTKEAKNQAFNVHNGTVTSWSQVWPTIADYFYMPAEVSDGGMDMEAFFQEREGKWAEILEKHGCQQKHSLKDLTTPSFFKFYMSMEWDNVTSIDKLRSFGFKEELENKKMFIDLFGDLKRDGIIPAYAHGST